MKSRTYTTYEAAARIGVSRQTVYMWIRRGEIVAPELIRVGKSFIRVWTLADIEHAKKFKGTLKTGPKPKNKR